MATKIMRGEAPAPAAPMGKIVAFLPKVRATVNEQAKSLATIAGATKNEAPPNTAPIERRSIEANPEREVNSELSLWLQGLGLPRSYARQVCAQVRMMATADLQKPHLEKLINKATLGVEKQIRLLRRLP